jgi:hypothetical protein
VKPGVRSDVAATGMTAAVLVVTAIAPAPLVLPAPPAVVPPAPAVVPVGGVDVGGVDEGGDVQAGVTNVLVSNVTAPLRASARPMTVRPVSTVIEVNAMIVPVTLDPGFNVAELPTCQNTLRACAPLVITTLPPVSVVSAEPT